MSRTIRGCLVDCVTSALACAALTCTASAQSGLVAWGRWKLDTRWFDVPHTALSAGPGQTLARLGDGSVVAWGNNETGQCELAALPTGITVVDFAAGAQMSLVCLSNGEISCVGGGCDPVGAPPLAAGQAYVSIKTRGAVAAALRNDGAAVFWGGNNLYGQLDVPAPPPGVAYVEVAVGDEHAAGVLSDGSLACWGNNANGQCNVPALPSGVTYKHVALGSVYSVALRSDGEIVGFGANFYGQCDTPTLPPGISYVEVSAGDWHTTARRSDGEILCWGANFSGQCDVPALPPGLVYTEVEAGQFHTLARRSDGVTLAWGDAGAAEAFPMPALPPGVSYQQVAAAQDHIVVLRSDGAIVCWGRRDSGQGDVPPIPSGVTCVEVAAGNLHSLARLSDGSVLAWGTNVGFIPALPVGVTYVAISGGGMHSMALRSDGAVVCWGDNSHGQCLVPPLPSGVTYVAIDAGVTHSTALRSDGAVICWGDNNLGQCNVPALPAGVAYVEVSAGGFVDAHPPYAWITHAFTLARRSDGVLARWGDNSLGQCSPAALPSGVTFAQFDAGASHSVAIRSDGVAVGWRLNDFGQSYVPAQPMSSRYAEIVASDGFTLARFEVSTPVVFCTAGTTTHGCNASISASGQPSATLAYPCVLAVTHVEGDRFGLLLYGIDNSGFTPTPWGAGSSFLCVKPPLQRTFTQSSGGAPDSCEGSMTLDWNAYQQARPDALGNPWLAGSKVFAQAWFRDPPAPTSTSLSDALELTYQP